MLARGDLDGRVWPGPSHALGTDGAAGHDRAENVHILAAHHVDMAARFRSVQDGGLVNIDAAALGVGSSLIGSVLAQAAIDIDVFGDGEKSFVVNPAVGLQGETSVRPLQDHIPAIDQVVFRGQGQIGIVQQACDGARNEETKGSMTKKVRGGLNLQSLGHPVVIRVFEVSQVEMACVVLHRPSFPALDRLDRRSTGRQRHIVFRK